MDWKTFLSDDESIQWQGRPAPRCYTFRNWRHSVFGIILLLLTTWWQSIALQMAAVYELPWLAWLPVPILLAALYLSLGHLLLARLEWNRVYYAMTDRQLLVQRGLMKSRIASLPLDRVTYFRLRPLGLELGSLRVYGEEGDPVLPLSCIEYPRQLTDLLEAAMGEKACRVEAQESDTGLRTK